MELLIPLTGVAVIVIVFAVFLKRKPKSVKGILRKG